MNAHGFMACFQREIGYTFGPLPGAVAAIALAVADVAAIDANHPRLSAVLAFRRQQQHIALKESMTPQLGAVSA
jgi:hypothetical protein